MQKLLSLIRSHLCILAFVAIAFGVLVMKSLPMPKSRMDLNIRPNTVKTLEENIDRDFKRESEKYIETNEKKDN